MPDAIGWAVVTDGEIDVRSVSPDRQGALINWLVVVHGSLTLVADTGEEIEERWNHHKGDAEAVPVRIMISG